MNNYDYYLIFCIVAAAVMIVIGIFHYVLTYVL